LLHFPQRAARPQAGPLCYISHNGRPGRRPLPPPPHGRPVLVHRRPGRRPGRFCFYFSTTGPRQAAAPTLLPRPPTEGLFWSISGRRLQGILRPGRKAPDAGGPRSAARGSAAPRAAAQPRQAAAPTLLPRPPTEGLFWSISGRRLPRSRQKTTGRFGALKSLRKRALGWGNRILQAGVGVARGKNLACAYGKRGQKSAETPFPCWVPVWRLID
jgi:hypothetical protein